MAPKNSLKMYQDVQIESVALGGRSADLVVVLYDHLIQHLGEAEILMSKSDYLEAGRRCSKALTIIAGLRETLDFEHGEPVAGNLLKFYNAVTSKIIGAQTRKDSKWLGEAAALVLSVREAWSHLASQGVDHKQKKSFAAVSSRHVDAVEVSAVALSGAGVAAAV